ncbi:MAG: CHAT domain-containing protein, partial [Methanobacteriota archaeon]
KELEAYEKAYQIAQQIKAVYTGHLIARNLVDALIRDGKYKEAINLALKNIPLARNIGTDNHRAYLLYASGQAYYYLEQLHNTQAAYDAAQKIWEKKKHVYYPNLIRVMFTQGDIYLQMYLTRLAQFRYQQGLQLAKRFQSKKSILIGYQRLGKLYYEMEDYPKAIEYFLLYKNNTTRPYYLCYANDMLGACYLKLKDYQKSREYYRAAYEISKNLSDLYHAYIAVDWAKINLYSGNMDEASEYYQEALNIADSFSSREEEVNELYVLIYNGMGEISLAAEDIPGAIGNFRRAVKYVEAGREALKVEDFRIGYFSEEVKIYNRLANCYFRLYQEQHRTEYVDSLYWFLEMARGRTLKDIPQQKSGLNLWGESPQVQRYKEISHKLEKLQRKLRIGNSQYLSPEAKDSLLTQIELVRYELVEAKLRMLKEAGDVSSNYIVKPLGDIQNDLEGMKAAVLLYQIGQEESYVLVVTSDHVQVVPLTITQKALETKISQLINPFHQISSHDIQKIPFYASIAHELYQKLFFPIEQAMNLPENLFVVPDFTMTNLPLEILLTEPPRQEIYTPLDNPDYTGHFLVHRYIFSYTPTVVLIKPRSKFPLRKPRVAVFANPVDSRKYLAQMPAQPSVPGKETTPGGRTTSRMRDGIIIDRHFSPLIFAEVEGEKIQKIYPPTNIYFRDEFNTEIFKKVADDYDVIHLATHGFVETSFDAFSGLVMGLSNQETDDGFLMGYEIAELSLDDCELITLSACETGQGEIKAGEGVLGLPRLFLVAGVKTVLMTLWKVDDQFTAQLMPEFYEYLFKKDA